MAKAKAKLRRIIEIHGETGWALRGTAGALRRLGDAPTLLRFIDCREVLLEFLYLFNPKGPADPHGQCVQFIRSTGTVRGCAFVANAGENDAEDLLSVYGDDPDWAAPTLGKSGAHVVVSDCNFKGRGPSDSGTSICQDGAFPPLLLVERAFIRGARVGFQHAGGNARLLGCNIAECDEQCVATDLQYYVKQRKAAGKPVACGKLLLHNVIMDRPVFKGKLPGKVTIK